MVVVAAGTVVDRAEEEVEVGLAVREVVFLCPGRPRWGAESEFAGRAAAKEIYRARSIMTRKLETIMKNLFSIDLRRMTPVPSTR
jgi:hypothetical protein